MPLGVEPPRKFSNGIRVSTSRPPSSRQHWRLLVFANHGISSLLQLLLAYVDKQDDWERYVPLVLYVYRTSVLLSTAAPAFLLMYGHNPSLPLSKWPAFDAFFYPAHLLAKIADLRDFVETTLEAADAATLLLSLSTAGKLVPKLEGECVISQ